MKKEFRKIVFGLTLLTIISVICVFVYAGGGGPKPFSNFKYLYLNDSEVATDDGKVHVNINANFNEVTAMYVDFVELDSNGNEKELSKDLMLKVQDLKNNPYVQLPARVLKENTKLKVYSVSTTSTGNYGYGYSDYATFYSNKNCNSAVKDNEYDFNGHDIVTVILGQGEVKKEPYWNFTALNVLSEMSIRDLQENGNKLHVSLTCDIDNISKITCQFMEREFGGYKATPDDLILNVENLKIPREQYVVLPERVVQAGKTLEVFDVTVYDNNNNSIVYSNWTSGNFLSGNTWIKITEWQDRTNDIMPKLELKTTRQGINGKVDVDMQLNTEPSRVLLSFVDETGTKSMVVYLQGLKSGKHYFMVPYTTEPGKYNLKTVTVTDITGKLRIFENGKSNDFKETLEIIDEPDKYNILYLDNEKITSKVIQEINSAKDDIIISINADNDPVINKDIFTAIKGTTKVVEISYNGNQWVFSGLDITDPKTIDVSSTIIDLNYTDTTGVLSKLGKGMLLKFADNGNLPGKCLMRLAVTETLTKLFGDKPLYVYYYDENGDILDKVAMKVYLSEDGYYEFYINHNSNYVLTSEEVNGEYVSDKTDLLSLNENISNNLQSENANFLNLSTESWIIIAVASVIIIILIVIVIISRRKK